LNEAQKTAVLASKDALEKSGVLQNAWLAINVASTPYPGEFQLEAQRNAEVTAKVVATGKKPGADLY